MQFVTNGPDIPWQLVNDHEEGKVVFFCGAGISIPAGLPGFKKLVNDVYGKLGTEQTDLEADAYESFRYDQVLDELEHRFPGQRDAVRGTLVELFQPHLESRDVLKTHEALLRLGRTREGTLRLVTTNFDSIFELASESMGQTCRSYAAPLLPLPKNCRWDGLVYLHGRLPKQPNETALNNVVVTSGDFGRAYLTECWAARFVRDLLRNYEVCFVGYSIEDPVLRYMLDALAADRMQGEYTPTVWAFGDSLPELDAAKKAEWEAKGVIPILYDKRNGHAVLHQTLRKWAETYRQSTEGKAAIIDEYALRSPEECTAEENYVGRFLWALSEKTGLPAKRFAEFNPPPPLEWMLAASHQGAAEKTECPCRDAFAKFHALWMHFVSCEFHDRPLGPVLSHLARWLLRYLNDPRLVVWISQQGGWIHPDLRSVIDRRLSEIVQWEKGRRRDLLQALSRVSPDAIPDQEMRTLWNLLLSGQMEGIPSCHSTRLRNWQERIARDGVTASLRIEFRKLLAPHVRLTGMCPNDHEPSPGEAHENRVCWEISLGGLSTLAEKELTGKGAWMRYLPDLFPDFEQILRDILGLIHQLGGEPPDLFLLRSEQLMDSSPLSPELKTFLRWMRTSWCQASHESDPKRFALFYQEVVEAFWDFDCDGEE